MIMTKYYSKTSGGFYPVSMRDKYESAGTWPDDAIEVSADTEEKIRNAVNGGQNVSFVGDELVITPRVISAVELITANELAIQIALDAKARERGYDSIKSACSYASSSQVIPADDPHFPLCEKFRLEGNALQAWASITWASAIMYLATVTSGENRMPTPEEAVSMMPAFEWPA